MPKPKEFFQKSSSNNHDDEIYIEPAGDEDYEDEDYAIASSTSTTIRGESTTESTVSLDVAGSTSTTSTLSPITSTTLDSYDDSDPINQPYIHLNGFLPNLTRNEGDILKLKCNVAGTLPIAFKWYKNDAPLLKDKNRIVVKDRDYLSRLTIRTLEPLDQAFYRCEGSNTAGSVNSTALIQVRPNKNRLVGTAMGQSVMKSGNRQQHNSDRFDHQDEDELFFMKPHTCQEYPFEACRDYLAGQKIYVHSRNIEDMKDIDRRLRAAFMVISNSSQVSDECKVYAARAACYHSYQVCDEENPTPSRIAVGSNKPPMPSIRRICKQDCDKLEKDVCAAEYNDARSQNLIGNEREQILPDCRDLNENVDRCLPVVGDHESTVETSGSFCYSGRGETFRGQISTTKSGSKCQKWSDAAKKYPAISPNKFSELKYHNFCRNPGSVESQPWCYNSKGQKESCDVPRCPPGTIHHNSNHDRSSPSDNNGQQPGGGIGGGLDLSFLGIPSEYAQYVVLAGGIIGVLLIVGLFLVACYCCRRSRRNRGGGLGGGKSKKVNGTMIMANGGGHMVHNGAAVGATAHHQLMMANGHANHHLQQQQRGDYFGGAIGNGMIRKPPTGNGQQMEMSSLLPPMAAQTSSSSGSPMIEALPEISASSLEYVEELGEGQFGKVWRANLNNWSRGDMDALSALESENEDDDEHRRSMQVAVKTLKDDASPRMRQDFEREATMMARLKHPNIVELVGVSTKSGGHPCMIFEYMMHGNLNEFLLLRSPYSQPESVDNERILLDHSDFLHIATQIASGMEYLSSQHYVHRDLATRNCLVADRLTIKISDFGLMRDVYASDYYRQQSNTFLPIRWMSPEAVMYGRYSEASDVWSYGVSLWEMYSYGTQPYYGSTNPEVADMVRQRCLLACPDNCPPRMYSLMVECWHETPTRRPRFAEIHARLRTWSVVSSPAHSSATTTTTGPPGGGLLMSQRAMMANGGGGHRMGGVTTTTATSSVHSDRSGGSGGTTTTNNSFSRSRMNNNNNGLMGTPSPGGQLVSTSSIGGGTAGSIPPACTPSSRNSPYPNGHYPNGQSNGLVNGHHNHHHHPYKNGSSSASPQMPRTPISVNGYALRAQQHTPNKSYMDMEP